MKLSTIHAKHVLAITAMVATSHITSGLTNTTPTASNGSAAPTGSRDNPAVDCNRPPPPEEVVGYFIQSFDRNKDGGLSIEELTAALASGPPPPPEGETQEERPAAEQKPGAPDHAEVATALVQLFDSDKSGNLDKQELAIAMGALTPPPPPRGGARPPENEQPS